MIRSEIRNLEMDSQNCSRCNLTVAEQHAHHVSTTAAAGVVVEVRTDEVLGAENDKEVKNRNDEQRR
jgi:hypothetical protein